MLLKRSTNAKYAKNIFLRDHNEINVYIEDTESGSEKIYTNILNKLFEGEYKIKSVLPLGGRIEVVRKCREKKNNNIKEIFIIDGDLYLISGENKKTFGDLDSLKKLFVLPKYCIENFLITRKGIIEILDEESPVKSKGLIECEIALNTWYDNHLELYRKLYIEYAVARKTAPQIQTISFKITNLVDNGRGELSEAKVIKRANEVKEKIIKKIGERRYKKHKRRISREMSNLCFLKFASGKDHILPLIRTRMERIADLKWQNDTYKIRFSKRVQISEFLPIKHIINSQ